MSPGGLGASSIAVTWPTKTTVPSKVVTFPTNVPVLVHVARQIEMGLLHEHASARRAASDKPRSTQQPRKRSVLITRSPEPPTSPAPNLPTSQPPNLPASTLIRKRQLVVDYADRHRAAVLELAEEQFVGERVADL